MDHKVLYHPDALNKSDYILNINFVTHEKLWETVQQFNTHVLKNLRARGYSMAAAMLLTTED